MTRFDKVRLEGEARGKAEGKAEAARNLLKAGISKEVIIQATGLTMADIERQSGMPSYA